MLKELELHRVGPVLALKAVFGERLNILTGDNGLGKSFVLDVAWWALTGHWASEPALPGRAPHILYHVSNKKGPTKARKTANFDFERQRWVRPLGRPSVPGLVVYARVDGGFSVWGPGTQSLARSGG